MKQFDDRDQTIATSRLDILDINPNPRCGDWVEFANGVTRRISHVWPEHIQTSDDGPGYYLGQGYVSYSGNLYRSVPSHTLTQSPITRPGRVWFFHHGYQERDNGVETTIPFRVYTCSEEA